METTQKVKVYLSGAISGNKNFLQDFKDGEERVKKIFESSNKDIVILNPAIFPHGLTQCEYMLLSIIMIDMCDWVVCLPNHENSEGSAVEVAYAKKCGKSVMNL